MRLAENILKVFAPHACVGCGALGGVVCADCAGSIKSVPSRCFYCHKTTKEFKTCLPCRRKTGLYQVFIVSAYEGVIKDAIHALKYERVCAAATDIVRHIDFPILNGPSPIIFSHIPTSFDRIRQRGYDQAQLIATALAEKYSATALSVFKRIISLHQIGAKGDTRRNQLHGAFVVTRKPSGIIILVDDVTTTGATVIEAAKTLHKSGVRRVSAYILAQA